MAYNIQIYPGMLRFGPSDCLIAMFRDCSIDPSEAIKARLRRMLHSFLQHRRDNAENGTIELAERCCYEAGIWYYRVLQSHVNKERLRLGLSDISVLLGNDLFHRCLVACCLEIAISSNSLPCDFPLLLQILSLAPYHFWRVIELVLRAEVGLPCAVVRHLAQVEEKVVESLAWASGSLLWEDIQANEGHLPTCQQVMLSSQLEDPNITDSQTEGNLLGDGHSVGAAASGTVGRQPLPSAANRPRRSNAFHLFARKVYSLMGRRLRELCATLHISDELRLKIWTCFEHSLVHCTDLMVDRHLDQLLMCAIYIIAKLTNGDIPFKHIMKCYESQPLTRKSVCKNVLISGRDVEDCLTGNNNNGVGILIPPWQEERGNIIYFYNQVYTTKMQHFAHQFAPTPGVDTPPLSPYPRQWKAFLTRRRLTGSHSIYISPYSTETTHPCTPGLCYYFNSSTPECLREINNMVRAGGACGRRRYALSLDQEEDDEEGPAAKRLRVDDQSTLQQRLRAVVNDRMIRRGLE